jgi:putative nucleotidyltransferase with HDIG domain
VTIISTKMFFSLRMKLFFAFFCLSTLIASALSYTLFVHMRSSHQDTLKRDLAIIAGLVAVQAETKFGVGDAFGSFAEELRQQDIKDWLNEIAGKSDVFSRAYILRRQKESVGYALYAQSESSGNGNSIIDYKNSQYVAILDNALQAIQVTGELETDLTIPITAFARISGKNTGQEFVLGIEVNPAKVEQDVRHFAERIMYVTFGAIFVVGIISWILARNFTKRLFRLSEAINRIQAGQLNVGLPESERDEIDELASHLRQLAMSIHGEREELLLAAIESLVTALEAKDPYTFGHSAQVSSIAVAIATQFHLTEQELFNIRIAALLHDIGKIGIPDHILHKDGKPSDEEWRIIQQHPMTGARILAGIPALSIVTDMVLHHHARWDGQGYPEKTAGEVIPFGARVIAVADSFQAMVSDRPYRKGMAEAAAMAEIRKCSGTQFDTVVVAAFERSRANLRTVTTPSAIHSPPALS